MTLKLPAGWGSPSKASSIEASNQASITAAALDMSEATIDKGLCPECKRPMESVWLDNAQVWVCQSDRIVLPKKNEGSTSTNVLDMNSLKDAIEKDLQHSLNQKLQNIKTGIEEQSEDIKQDVEQLKEDQEEDQDQGGDSAEEPKEGGENEEDQEGGEEQPNEGDEEPEESEGADEGEAEEEPESSEGGPAKPVASSARKSGLKEGFTAGVVDF